MFQFVPFEKNLSMLNTRVGARAVVARDEAELRSGFGSTMMMQFRLRNTNFVQDFIFHFI
jgi:aspartate/tyrosine/aromatic aminotransferase